MTEKEFYIQLQIKLNRIKYGNLSLDEFILEVEAKITKLTKVERSEDL